MLETNMTEKAQPHVRVISLNVPIKYGDRGPKIESIKESLTSELENLSAEQIEQLVYILSGSIQGTKRLKPVYVGKSSDRRNTLNRVRDSVLQKLLEFVSVEQFKNKPKNLCIHILDVSHFSTRNKHAELKTAETVLIRQALKMNPNLLNKVQKRDQMMIQAEIPLSIVGVKDGPFKWKNRNKGKKRENIKNGETFAKMLGWN